MRVTFCIWEEPGLCERSADLEGLWMLRKMADLPLEDPFAYTELVCKLMQ